MIVRTTVIRHDNDVDSNDYVDDDDDDDYVDDDDGNYDD